MGGETAAERLMRVPVLRWSEAVLRTVWERLDTVSIRKYMLLHTVRNRSGLVAKVTVWQESGYSGYSVVGYPMLARAPSVITVGGSCITNKLPDCIHLTTITSKGYFLSLFSFHLIPKGAHLKKETKNKFAVWWLSIPAFSGGSCHLGQGRYRSSQP